MKIIIRAALYDKVFVHSYTEEYTDKDGNGTFTLVMKSIAAKHAKTTNKVAETVDKVFSTNISKDDLTIESVGDNVQKQAETFHPTDAKDALENILGFDNLGVEKKTEFINALLAANNERK